MKNLLVLENISLTLADQELYDGLNFSIGRGARHAIIGSNGSGKSTLLKIITGDFNIDSGRVLLNVSESKTYLVRQVEQALNQEERSVLDYATAVLAETTADTTPGHYQSRVQAEKYFSMHNFINVDQSVKSLSGGWQKRLQIIIGLASEPELILFDEPSNHLDIAGILWLEDELKNANYDFLLVSHDRYFLNQSVQTISELGKHYDGNLFTVDGNYEQFIERRADYQEQAAEQLTRLKNKARKEGDWVSRMPKARSTKATYRVKQFAELTDEIKNQKNRQVKTNKADTSFSASDRKTKTLVELYQVSKAYGEQKLLTDFSKKISAGSKIGILGSNGQGKSTLLKLIAKQIEADSGTVKHADHLRVVIFDQFREKLDPKDTLRTALAEGSDQVIYQDKPVHYLNWAERFGFTPADLVKTVGDLSGGQHARLLLSILVRQEADLLLLDEPGNDLDIDMLEKLEQMIGDFTGAVVMISHDRYLINEACNIFFGFNQQGELAEYANYQQWEDLYRKPSGRNNLTGSSAGSAQKGGNKNASKAERKELAKTERAISKIEQEILALQKEAGLEEVYLDAAANKAVAQQILKKQSELDQVLDRWQELEELISG